MTHLPLNSYYRICAAHSGFRLGVVKTLSLTERLHGDRKYRGGDDDGAVFHLPRPGDDEVTEFLILPADADHVAIVPRRGAKVWDVSVDAHPVTAIAKAAGVLGRELILYRWHAGDNQRFRLVSSGGAYKIHPRSDVRAFVDVPHASKDTVQMITWKPTEGDNQRFEITPVETFTIPSNPNGYPIRDVLREASELPEATGMKQPPSIAHPSFIGQTVIPFLFVDDPGNDRAAQGLYSPLYIFRREQLWTQVACKAFDGPLGPKETVDVVTGVTDQFKASVEQTLKMSITPKFGFKAAQGFGLDATFNSELKISASAAYSFEAKKIVKIEWPAPKEKCVVTVWAFAHRYTLVRFNPAEPNKAESQVFSYDVNLPETVRYTVGQ